MVTSAWSLDTSINLVGIHRAAGYKAHATERRGPDPKIPYPPSVSSQPTQELQHCIYRSAGGGGHIGVSLTCLACKCTVHLNIGPQLLGSFNVTSLISYLDVAENRLHDTA